MTSSTYPRTVTHVGLTVPDIEAALEWYANVLGFERLAGPTLVTANEGLMGATASDVLGAFETVKIAHVATGNGVAIEFFEFDTTPDRTELTPTAGGYFHLCVVDPDIEALAARIDESGGDHFSDVWPLFDDQPYRMTYCTDPWGNYIEIYTHSHERIYSNQEY